MDRYLLTSLGNHSRRNGTVENDWWNEVELKRVQEMVDITLECGYELPASSN